MKSEYNKDSQKTYVKVILTSCLQGKTISCIAQKIGVSAGTLSSWKNGRTVPSEDRWNRCAAVLGFSPRGLYTTIDNESDDSFETIRQAAVRMDVSTYEMIKMGRESIVHAFNHEQLYDIREMNAVLEKSRDGTYVAAYPIDFDPAEADKKLDSVVERVFGHLDEDEQGA
ncbi:MAG: helix-turn-helix transcriptional regulator [Akkermansia sp.]|nr:helix-turn-helix transcriptional regulator [Akkermansia sp.]